MPVSEWSSSPATTSARQPGEKRAASGTEAASQTTEVSAAVLVTDTTPAAPGRAQSGAGVPPSILTTASSPSRTLRSMPANSGHGALLAGFEKPLAQLGRVLGGGIESGDVGQVPEPAEAEQPLEELGRPEDDGAEP